MLKTMQSYELILRTEVPKGCQILQSKMDLKTKKDAMGRITKRKARLVALGNLEWETVRDTYAPTVNAKTINLMLTLLAQEWMFLYGLDTRVDVSLRSSMQSQSDFARELSQDKNKSGASRRLCTDSTESRRPSTTTWQTIFLPTDTSDPP